MTTHVSVEQVRWWLDDNAIQDVTAHTDEETEFNLQVTLSRLPIHLIKERPDDPIRIVGRNDFDTERARKLLRDAEPRTEFLGRIGPVLATTPGFYTFLDEEDRSSELRYAEALQIEHRIYPDQATQQALMDSVMAVATGMRFVQNVMAASRSEPPGPPSDAEDAEPVDSDGPDEPADAADSVDGEDPVEPADVDDPENGSD